MPNHSQEPPVSSKDPKLDFKDRCSLHLHNQDREPKFGSWVYQRPVTISKSRLVCQTRVRHLQHPPKSQKRTIRTWIFFVLSKSKQRTEIWNLSLSKSRSRYQTPVRNILNPPKSQIRTSRTFIFFVPSKSR